MSESAMTGDEKKGLKISKIILDKPLSPQHIRQLLSEGKTELINGFISKKKRPFDAYLLLCEKWQNHLRVSPADTEKTPKKN